MKYTLRKLGLVVFLALLVASPFLKVEYDRRTTTDPYILMAREIENWRLGEVDVIKMFSPGPSDGVLTLVFIENFPTWSDNDRENFKRAVLHIVRENGTFKTMVIAMGWNYTPKTMRIQGIYACDELRAGSCTYDSVFPSIPVKPEDLMWVKIGRP